MNSENDNNCKTILFAKAFDTTYKFMLRYGIALLIIKTTILFLIIFAFKMKKNSLGDGVVDRLIMD